MDGQRTAAFPGPPLVAPLLLPLLLALAAGSAGAASTVLLPPARCSADGVFGDGFENVLSDPSGGSGGATAEVLRTIDVPGFGPRNFYLYVPPGYNPAVATPLVLLLHGQANSQPGSTDLAASGVRNQWSPAAVSQGFIVLAPTGHTAQGSWDIPGSYPLIDAGIADTLALYNIDRRRMYAWGFSAGANLLHALALSRSTQLAAYAVHAGSLVRGAGTGAPAAAQRKLPVQLWVGQGDSVYLPETMADRDVFASQGWVLDQTLHYSVHSGGHNYDTTQFATVWSRWCRFTVQADP